MTRRGQILSRRVVVDVVVDYYLVIEFFIIKCICSFIVFHFASFDK